MKKIFFVLLGLFFVFSCSSDKTIVTKTEQVKEDYDVNKEI